MRAHTRTRLVLWSLLILLPVTGAACGEDSSDDKAADGPSVTAGGATSATSAASGSSAASPKSGCGVTLNDVKAVLPANTPVAQNTTPDSRRCNFTWAQNGNWGIDVAFLAGGRTQVEGSPQAPGDGGKLKNGQPYESVSGVGDKAWATGNARHVGVGAIKGNDFVAADITYDGTPSGAMTAAGLNTDFLRITTELARKALAG